MAQRTDFSVQTNLGNVADPTLPQDSATKNYVDTRSGGAQYFDDVTLTNTGNVTIGIAVIGVSVIVISGDVTANYTIGDILVFQNSKIYPRYSVTAKAVSGGNTQLTINPALIQYVPAGSSIYKVTPLIQSYNHVAVADNLTGSVSNSVLTLDAIIENVPLVNPATAFKHGILTLGVAQSAPSLTISGEIGPTIGDGSSITVTSTPWPPSIPSSFNQSYIFIADSTNTDWAGVGTPVGTPNGIVDIQWIKRPPASIPFTGAGIWYSTNTTSQIYSAASINDAYNNNKVVTGVIFPELTHTLTTDTFGTKADVITALPFIQNNTVTALNSLRGAVTLASPDSSVNISTSGQSINFTTSGGSGWSVGGNSFSENLTKKIGSITANPLSVVVNNIEAINVSYGISTTNILTATGVGSNQINSFNVLPSGYSYLYKDGNLYKSDAIGGSFFTSISSIPNTNGGLAANYSSNVVVYPYVITNGGATQGFVILTDTPSGSETLTKIISPVLLTASGQNYNTFQSLSISPNGSNACVIMYVESTNSCVALTNNFNTSVSSVSFPVVIRNSQINYPIHAVYKDDNTLYVIGSGMDLYQMNVTTGAITSLGVTFSNETSVYIFYTNGSLYISGFTGLYLVDQTTWRATKLSTYAIPGGDYWASVPFDRSRIKLYFGNSTNTIYEFDGTGNVLVDGGHFQVSDGTSVTLGNGAGYDAPLIAANAVTPTTLSAGITGQVLKSRGAGRTPHWGDASDPYSSNATVVQIVSTTAGAIGNPISGFITTAAPLSASFTTRFNNLNLTVNTGTGVITGWVANAVYKVTMTSYWNTTTNNTFTAYFCAVNEVYPRSYVNYGEGVTACCTRTGSNRGGDGTQSTSVGYWTPSAPTTPLNLTIFIDPLGSGTASMYLVLLIERFN